MNDFQNLMIVFDPVGGWAVTGAITLSLLAYIAWTYPPRIAHLPLGRQRLLLTLRYMTALLLAIGFMRPGLQLTKKNDDKPLIIILGDSSRSMVTTDGPGNIARRQSLLNLLQDNQTTFKSLSQKVEIRNYDFADKAMVTPAFTDKSDGDSTALGSVIDQVIKDNESQRIAAIFMLSDGAERSMPGKSIPPMLAAQTLVKQAIPFYAIPIGGAVRKGESLDVAIEELNIDPIVFEKKTMSIRAKVYMQGASGRTVKVRLLIENREGKKLGESGTLQPVPANGKQIHEVTITPSTNEETQTVELTYEPSVAGEYKMGVEAIPLSEEVIIRNNIRETLVSVRKGGLRVAYFDVPREEVKFIRKLNQSEKIQVDYHMIRSTAKNEAGAISINTKWFEPGAYDVYILGDVSANVFGPKHLSMLADRVKQGAGLMMLGGYHSFGAGGYGKTPLAALLPVQMSPVEEVPMDQINPGTQQQGLFKLQPTPAGINHFIMRIDAGGRNEELWKSLPEISHFNRLKPANDFVQVLATTQEKAPVLIATETGQGRVIASALSETFLWVLDGHGDQHQRFWKQLIMWLSHKEFDSDQTLWVRVTPRNYAPGSAVAIEYGAHDGKGENITDATFNVTTINPLQEKQAVNGQAVDQGYIGEYRQTNQPGDYWVEVNGNKDGQSLGLSALTRFIVDAVDLELDNPSADVAELEEICHIAAETTDSQVVLPEQFSDFLQNYLRREPWKRDVEYARMINLWDGWPFLAIFVSLLTCEWFFRKQFQMI